jgi:hypothetical protein
MLPMMTQLRSTKSVPNARRAISIDSARSSAVTEPMNGLSDKRMWE